MWRRGKSSGVPHSPPPPLTRQRPAESPESSSRSRRAMRTARATRSGASARQARRRPPGAGTRIGDRSRVSLAPNCASRTSWTDGPVRGSTPRYKYHSDCYSMRGLGRGRDELHNQGYRCMSGYGSRLMSGGRDDQSCAWMTWRERSSMTWSSVTGSIPWAGTSRCRTSHGSPSGPRLLVGARGRSAPGVRARLGAGG